MPLQLITAPTVEPVTLARAKLHLRVDVSDDDELITAMIASARVSAEAKLQRAILPQTLELTLDEFPGVWGPGTLLTYRHQATLPARLGAIELPGGPVSAVSSVKYLDLNGAEQTLVAGTDYQVDLRDDRFGRVLPVYGGSWPTTRPDINAVRVRYVAGWLDATGWQAVFAGAAADAGLTAEPLPDGLRISRTSGTHGLTLAFNFSDLALDWTPTPIATPVLGGAHLPPRAMAIWQA